MQQGHAVDSALCADAPVTLEYALAKMSWIGAQSPFLYAPVRTKSQPATRHFQAAPAAETAAIRPFGQALAGNASARHRPPHTHDQSIEGLQMYGMPSESRLTTRR